MTGQENVKAIDDEKAVAKEKNEQIVQMEKEVASLEA